MQILFPYEIINRYYKGYIYKNDVVRTIKLFFNNEINKINNIEDESKNKSYELIHNNNHYLYKFSSKIIAYNFLLFGYHEYINNWINNQWLDDRILFDYNINNVIDEPCIFSELDNLYYVDLLSIFDKFFCQINENLHFELHEIN